MLGRRAIAEGIAERESDVLTRGLVRAFVDGIVLVGENRIEQAISLAAEAKKTQERKKPGDRS